MTYVPPGLSEEKRLWYPGPTSSVLLRCSGISEGKIPPNSGGVTWPVVELSEPTEFTAG